MKKKINIFTKSIFFLLIGLRLHTEREEIMKNTYNVQQKQAVLKRYHSGMSVRDLVTETGIPRSTIYAWLEKSKETGEEHFISRKAYNQLQEHAHRLEEMLEILKTCDCAPHDPLSERLKTLEQLYNEGGHSVRVICEALDVPRGTFYNHIFRNKREESNYEKRREELRGHIRKAFEDSHQIFGAAKIVAVLREQGINTTIETVRQLMREMGLTSVRKGAKKQYEDESRKTRNIVRRNFQVDRPNAVWVSDVTFFRFNDLYYSICIIMDLYARKIISYRVGTNNSTQLVKSTFREAYESRKPEKGLLFHSDQGSNYRSRAFRAFLTERGAIQSFSNPGSPYDNSVAESFFSSMKSEELYRYKYRSEKELREGVARYIRFYNSERPHKSLNYKTPNQKEQEYWTVMEKS